MFWSILAAAVTFYVLRAMWRAYSHPAHSLGRQASQMNWNYSRTVEDESGNWLTCVFRDSIEAKISYEPPGVVLLKPAVDRHFCDFVDVERWLASGSRGELSGGKSHSASDDFDPDFLMEFDRETMEFAREISDWPPEQARRALVIVRATLSGDDTDIEEEMQELTVAQSERVVQVVRRIHGDEIT